MSNYTFTSESVTEGHPDKMADQVSDAVLDAILAEDPNGRVACETLLTTGLCVVAGEITTSAYVDIPKLAREIINGIGYDNALYGFDGNTCGVIVSIDEQSPDIAQGVDKSEELRGGRSGEDFLEQPGRRRPGHDVRLRLRRDPRPDAAADLAGPSPGRAAHRGAQGRRRAVPAPRRQDPGHVRVRQHGKPVRLSHVLISTQHQDGIDRDTVIRPDLIEQVIRPIVPAQFADDDYDVYINPTGKFVIGGPHGDTGLTGRKIIVDTYGGMGRHGGGAFSGKDPARSTVRRPTPLAGWPSTSSPPVRRRAARCRWRTPSAWRTR